MAGHQIGDIRNIALVGHTASGKTTLGEAILLKAGITSRLGNVDDGSSMLDYDEESKDRKHSVESSLFYCEHQGKLLNFIDTPGTPDYCGQALAGLIGADIAMAVVNASSGMGINTRRMMNAAGRFGLARMIAVTRIDAENLNLEELLNGLKETFGNECVPINVPADGGKRVVNLLTAREGDSDLLDVAAAHKQLVEAIVETDEELMLEYMESGEMPLDQLAPAIHRAVAAGSLIPIMFVSSSGGVGIEELLDALISCAPSPAEAQARKLIIGADEAEGEAGAAEKADVQEETIEAKADGDFIAQTFKVVSDPKSNIKYSVARVFSGELKPDGNLFVSGDRKGQRPGHIFKLRGNGHEEVPTASAGDIVAFAKLDLKIGDTLFDKSREGRIAVPKFPTPMFSLALEPKSRGDVEKVSGALQRFAEEDPCFQYHRDAETHELVMSGVGDQHLNVVQSKMKRFFKLEVDTKPPKIPYRETITGSVKYVEYTHKKQSGGAGQFARVFVDMEPAERGEGYEFIDKIFGGSIDQAFRPSVDKGVRDQMKKGVIAGYPVVDVKVALVDGKTHPVDSKDIAFQIAGRQVFKKAFQQCKPIMLEPVVHIEVTVPTDNVGDITRDIAGKRGQIEGQDILPGGMTVVRGTVPLAEVANYSSQLKSATGGQGSYVMEFSHYDVVPPNVQQQIAAQYKAADEDE
jgi:elongation factor G